MKNRERERSRCVSEPNKPMLVVEEMQLLKKSIGHAPDLIRPIVCRHLKKESNAAFDKKRQ